MIRTPSAGRRAAEALGLAVALVLAPSSASATETEPDVPLPLLAPGRFIETPPPPAPEVPPAPETPPATEPPDAAPETPAPPPPPVDVLPPLALARVAGMELPDAPRSSDPVDRAERRLDRDLRGEMRRDAIRAGRADGYHSERGRAMRAELHVDPMELQADHVRGRSIPEIVVGELGRYGGYERPMEPRGTPTPESSRRTMDADEVQLDELMDFQNLLNGHVTWYRAVVRVMQNRSGEVFEVRLLRSSGMPSVDAAAIEAARRAVVEGPPPERVIVGRETISTDWAIEVGDVATDWGQVGCTEPTEVLTGGCAALGRGIVRTRVELLDVHDATFSPDPE